MHSYGLRPGFCIDLNTRNQNGRQWDSTNRRERDELLRLQEKEQPKLVIGAFYHEDLEKANDEVTKFLATMYRRQVKLVKGVAEIWMI